MLAYGDDYFEITLGNFLTGFERRLSASGNTLEEARLRLIFAGQLEQAVEDADLCCAPQCRRLTAATATMFVQAMHEVAVRHPRGAGSLLDELVAWRQAAAAEAHVGLRLKTPEGFAWYSLYPDGYVQAARSWAQTQAASRVLVVGIRSIGTTLGAVVAAALRLHGLQVTACTIRPFGHPFKRRSQLPEDLCLDAEHAIVVDEGPGLSGSSMASVAEVLAERGFNECTITFFPGHPHGPGQQSSEEVRRWWASVRQVAISWGELRLDRQGTSERLASSAAKVLNAPLLEDLIDLGAGRWRTLGAAGSDRPIMGVAPLFEQPKYLARILSGDGLLLKFAGLTMAGTAPDGALQSTAEHQMERLGALAEARFTPAPRGSADGWIMLPWIKGRRLTANDARGPMLGHIAAYIARSADRALTPCKAEEAIGRLRVILLANARHLLGQAAAARSERISDFLASELAQLEIASYGDGRLAPHEWIDTGDHVYKVDAAGHVQDHTAVGRQSLLWDVAGAAVDWQLEHHAACELAIAAGAHSASRAAVSYYSAAYAALRAGLANLCAAASPSAIEQDELSTARAVYSERLGCELTRMDTFLPERTYIETSQGT